MTCGECGNVTAPGAGFPNHVYCKRFLLHMEKREDASRCRDFIPKPITRYDRLIRKTPEEMAEFLTLIMMGEERSVPFLYSTVDKWLDWLKQEVPDDNN